MGHDTKAGRVAYVSLVSTKWIWFGLRYLIKTIIRSRIWPYLWQHISHMRLRHYGYCGAVAFSVVIGLAACSWLGGTKKVRLSERVIPLGQPVPKGGGVYKVGKPYQIQGRWYHPKEDLHYDREGIASWYGTLFHGRRTANGEIYDMDALTAAHPTLPLPVYARVTNLRNGRTMVVRINDRGPYAHDRIIDLSRRSAELLGFKRQGTARVRVTFLDRAPLNGNDAFERNYLARQTWIRRSPQWARRYAKVKLPKSNITVGSISRNRPTSTQISKDIQHSAYIQAGVFRNKDNAERLKQRLSSIAPTKVTPITIGEVPHYRVRLGPFSRRDQARKKLPNVIATGIKDPRIVEK